MKFQRHIPLVELLGFELLKFEPGQADIGVTVRDELCNSWKVVHGGTLMTLLDVAMAHAARSPNVNGEPLSPETGVVTIEMKTTFMQPGLGRLVAQARRVHATASLAFCEATVFDEQDKPIAQATGTFKFIRGLAAGGRTVRRLNASD